MRILIIEDDKEVLEFLKPGFKAESFAVDTAEDGETGSFLARTNDYDIILMDYLLPKMTGRTVCEEIRKENPDTPIIMLTVKSELSDKLDLFQIGVDDYLTKPFSFDELLARVHAILRRPKESKQDALTIDDLVLDIKSQTATRGGKPIYLTRKEFSLLEFLMRRPNEVQSRTAILEHVWDMNADPFSNTIESHILNVRKKVDKAGKKRLIHTVPGRGYKVSAVK